MRRALALALLALACAARSPPPSAAPPGAAPPAARRAPAAPVRYGAEPDAAPTPLEQAALDLARDRLAAGRARPRVSGALVAAARELAQAAAADDPAALARGRIRGALARAGCFDPAPTTVLVASEMASARAALAGALPRGRATDVGAGAAERPGRAGRAIVVVLASERRASLSPFPRDVDPGEQATLAGRLGAGLSRPRVFVATPSGRVREIEAGAGPSFRAAVAFPEAGRHAVEVIAEGAGGPEVVALLEVSAGGAPLDLPAAGPEQDPPGEAAAVAVVRAANATRRARGLQPLAASPALASVAERHSAAMAAAGTVAHVLPGSGDAGFRLRAAGIPYRRVLENVALSSSALAAHRVTEESPAHLASLLDPGATHVGVGIARRKLPSGEEAVYLTELFVEPPDDGAESPLTPDARVREALWAERARRALPPLAADPALDALARQAAAAMRARDEPGAPDLADRALALRRELAAADVFVASAPADALRSANLRDRRFRRVGVGVVTGDSRRFGAGRFWIAVVYTD